MISIDIRFRLSKTEQEQLELALQLSKETMPTNEMSIELPVIPEPKKTINSPSTASSHGSSSP